MTPQDQRGLDWAGAVLSCDCCCLLNCCGIPAPLPKRKKVASRGIYLHRWCGGGGERSVSKRSKGKPAEHLPGAPLLRLVWFGQRFSHNSHTPDRKQARLAMANLPRGSFPAASGWTTVYYSILQPRTLQLKRSC